jgi:dethiobiotin synthetase
MTKLYIASGNRKDGKTFITTGLAATMQGLGYATSVYKPIQTGCIEANGFIQSPDLTFVKTVDPYINTYFTYLFKSNAEPLIAAENENEYIDLELVNQEYSRILNSSDCTLIDGEGGLLSPIAPNTQIIDIIKKLQIPTIFTITPREDAINDVLLSINLAQEKGIEVRGVIINNIKEDCSKEMLTSITRIIEEYTSIKILGLIPYLGEKFSPEELITSILNGIDIESVFNIKIEKLGLE